MNTTELIRPPAARRRAASLSDAGHNVSASASAYRTFGEMLVETIPLVGAIAGYGPPVIFLAGPWLLLALVLSAPFAVLLTLIAVMLLAAAVLGALTAAILAPPYLLMRHLGSVRARRAFSHDRAAHLVPVGSTRVVS
jgi:hypothetical protein